MNEAILGKTILLRPDEPIRNYKVAIIGDNGFPVGLIETTLIVKELWEKATFGKM